MANWVRCARNFQNHSADCEHRGFSMHSRSHSVEHLPPSLAYALTIPAQGRRAQSLYCAASRPSAEQRGAMRFAYCALRSCPHALPRPCTHKIGLTIRPGDVRLSPKSGAREHSKIAALGQKLISASSIVMAGLSSFSLISPDFFVPLRVFRCANRERSKSAQAIV
jgi:hypothetical protein